MECWDIKVNKMAAILRALSEVSRIHIDLIDGFSVMRDVNHHFLKVF